MKTSELIEWLEVMKSEMTNEGKVNTNFTIEAIKKEGITNE